MPASQVLFRGARYVSRDSVTQKERTHRHTLNTTNCYFAEEGQWEGGVFDSLLHPQISGCYCAAA